ncbi:histidine kinase [Bifidobacterium aemilianum]|uniref:Histidine kinase n=1 Tax=Bifidobacterium aemilianum TaxID=2493120 RepID=A0A366K8D6_9BIFI|nr:ATP-binding protein [Bifidobacterium aemilianum]RBP97512.1 histidine kinase [Bifidobacterium aemilianum]
MRPRHGRVFCGVCRGVSIHLGLSVSLVRVLFTLSVFLFGSGLLAYVFLWMTMPVGDPMQAWYQESDRPTAPLARGNSNPSDPDPAAQPAQRAEAGNGEADQKSESLVVTLSRASKPSLIALAGLAFIALAAILLYSGLDPRLLCSLLLALTGLAVSWMRYNAQEGKLWTMLAGIVLIILAYTLLLFTLDSHILVLMETLTLLVCLGLALAPWFTSLIRDIGTERATKERAEERADMTAHLHDGVLQTLTLIQLHHTEVQTVLSLARQQERELRDWLYQERTPSDRSVAAGLKEIAGQVEDGQGKAIEVVTVGDASPSPQTDALLSATQQALINAATHGGEPISLYAEATASMVDVYVRDHGQGFDLQAVPPNRLGIRESIRGRVERRGGSVEIVSRPGWGTEVRMHMPISSRDDQADQGGSQDHNTTDNTRERQ